MAAAGEFPSHGKNKLCVTCGALMPTKATKCTKCETYQSWTHGLAVSTTMVALLTALLSVAATALPTLYGWWMSGNSRLSVSYAYDDDQGGLFLTATNDGDRVGSIGKVTIVVPVKGTNLSFPASLDASANPSVEPTKSQKIRFTLDVGQDLQNYTRQDVSGECQIVVSVREFVEKDPSRKLSLSKAECGDLKPLDFGK
ncbi:hypothetical protein JQ634_00960 [Bradyrhizobium sp. AUGA SZCCT0240]|uniref:hypothetical protein n=1 Tax=Bradyrhizobium sp. AUGA SZCCT0240 TaxID=2807669 RepID=UPI001BA45898|nr:hypothetical protein [Bradyrhizobium sp. AUGA SZCCT0240]MBR1252267.1 hypothetical protein [Bradyrhizobium sp. AUGA SZCCT0240]